MDYGQLKEIEIPFGAKDSELYGWEYTIPEGMEATIVGNKIVVKKKESEDESIRKELISHFSGYKANCSSNWYGIKVDSILAWLEKQGEQHPKFRIGDTIKKKSTGDIVTISEVDLKNREYRLSNTGFIPFKYEHLWELVEQKPMNEKSLYKAGYIDGFEDGVRDAVIKEDEFADKVEPKFKVGDWIVFNGLTLYVKEVVEGFYRTISKGGIPSSYGWDIDNAARLWTIQDAKDGNVLVASDKSLFIYDGSINENGSVGFHIAFTEDMNVILNSDDGCGWEDKDSCHPANKEQRNLLFQKIKEVGYVWDDEKKELKKIEWHREDEKEK